MVPTMTVTELIGKLWAMPRDARVLVSGYEGDLNDPDTRAPRLRIVHLDIRKAGYMGPHEKCGAEYYPREEWAKKNCVDMEDNRKNHAQVVVIER